MVRPCKSLWGSILLLGLSILHAQAAVVHGASQSTLGANDTSAAGDICSSLVVVHGYNCHVYEVITADGYILGVQRIPCGRSSVCGGDRPPVLIQHGVLVDGATWLLNQPDQNLPLLLAENGFDVWVSNFRGTPASVRHTTLNSTLPEYWNWSWDEEKAYDLPAVSDLVFNHTGQKMDYVGHSMGSLVALVGLSEGMLIDRLKSAALLSPIAYLSHMTTAIGEIAANSLLPEVYTVLGIAEFNPKLKLINDLLYSKCQEKGLNCADLLTLITGKNCCLNASTVDLSLKYEPQSTSSKTLVHLSQIVKSGNVAKYNYDNPDTNRMRYGTTEPPLYNLTNIPHDFPLFISYGGSDSLSDTRDVERLLDQLKSHDGDKLTVQFVKNYAHADYVIGNSAKDVVYEDVIAFFKRHQG